MRERLALDGRWAYYYDPDDGPGPPPKQLPDLAPSVWHECTLPAPWQSFAPGLQQAFGTVWHRRTFHLSLAWGAGAAILHFGAVNYLARVWLNGHFVGAHEGGYLPFEFEVSDRLRPGGENTLVVWSHLPGPDALRYPAVPFTEIPHGKQSWYGPLGGIWQPVWLERRPPAHIAAVRVTARDERVTVEARLSDGVAPDSQVEAEVLDAARAVVASTRGPADGLALRLPTPRLWHPDDPYLYTLRVTLEGETRDQVEEPFGVRTIESRDGRLWLNGEPLYLRGVLDQDYYPDLLCTPPSLAYIESQFRQVKAMGFNCVRIHIKVADPRYYIAADRVGLLVWTELPNWEYLTDESKARGRATLEGMIRRDWNHPSIIVWTIINEDWGTELTTTPAHREWLASIYEWVKALDPTRLVVDNSPCWPNYHVRGDIDDYHVYRAIPDSRTSWESWVAQYVQRPDWLYAPGYRDQRERNAPLLVSEFGNWGLPELEPLVAHYGGEPWWFESGWERATGEAYPHGLLHRFAALQLDKVFESYARLARASQAAQWEALKYQIETMRLYPQISGYVITELTDLHWEANGLLDILRTPKVFFDRVADLNRDVLLIARGARYAFWCDETPVLELYLSNVGPHVLEDATVVWRLMVGAREVAAGQMEGVGSGAGRSATLPALALPLPALERPMAATLHLTAHDPQGTLVARTEQPLSLFPRWRPARTVAAVDPHLNQQLAAAGYQVLSRPTPGVPLVTTSYDASAQQVIARGGRVLLLAEAPDAIQAPLPRFGLTLHARANTVWTGDWVGSFAWFRRDRFASAVPGDGRFDLACATVVPHTVISNARPQDFHHDILAGLFVGWIHRPVAFVQHVRIGEGRLLVSTLRMKDHLRVDPVAATFFEAHLAQLSQVQ